jgi:exosortase D (VPLPA-CTERM-specific)
MTSIDNTKANHIRSQRFGLNLNLSLLIATIIIGGTAFFWDGLVSLIRAWSQPEYSHGPIIPIIAGYLLLRELKNKPSNMDSGSKTPGLIVVLFGMLVGLVGNITQIPYFITYGMIIAIGGLILIVAGAKQGYRFWVPWFYLLFMLPLPTAMYWMLSVKLQFISSRLGVEVIKTMGIPVFLDGNVIDLGYFKLQVAEACNGLRYLFPLTSFGFLFAALYRGPLWHRIILFFSSVPLTILMNSFRIGVIGILVNSFGIDQAEGFLHWFEGWIIFLSCIGILYFEAFLLQRFTKNPQPILSMLDVDSSRILEPFRAVGNILPNKTLAAAAFILAVGGALWQFLPERSYAILERKTFAQFPLEINGWNGTKVKLEKIVEQALGADEYLSANFNPPNGEPAINLFMSFYFSTTDGSGIHSPQICIPGGGWEVSRWQQVKIQSGENLSASFNANRAIIQKGDQKQLVYYWFEMRGHRFTGEYEAKFNTIWESLTKSRADGALVRFVTPLKKGETESAAEKRISSFLPGVVKILPEYIPN